MKNILRSDNATFFKVKWMAGVVQKEHECYPRTTQDTGGLWSLPKKQQQKTGDNLLDIFIFLG